MHTSWRTLLGLLSVLAVLTAGCGGTDEGESAAEEAPASETSTEESEAESEAESETASEGGEVSGTINIDGSSTVGPLTDAISEEYAAEAPEVTVNLGISGTGGGFERFCAGETDISNASRGIADDEIAACEEAGVQYTEVRVGTDALTVVTNSATDFVDCLTFEEMASIWGAQDPATNWNQVRPDFPDLPLQVFAPDTDSGTYDFFTEEVLGDPDEGAEEPIQDYSANADDNVIAQGIIGTQGSWGYFGFAYFQENSETVKALAVDDGESGCVEPSLETAEAGEYPLARPLYIYVSDDALARPEVADYVNFYLETVGDVITDVGYVPAPEDAIAESQAAIEEAVGGGAEAESEGASESES